MKNFLEVIKGKHIKNYFDDEEKKAFVIEAIKNNLNHNICSKSDLIRAKKTLSNFRENINNEDIAYGAVVSYTLYQEIQKGKKYINQTAITIAILNISSAITEYLIFKTDEITATYIINKEINDIKDYI